jgi:hypothetical protein
VGTAGSAGASWPVRAKSTMDDTHHPDFCTTDNYWRPAAVHQVHTQYPQWSNMQKGCCCAQHINTEQQAPHNHTTQSCSMTAHTSYCHELHTAPSARQSQHANTQTFEQRFSIVQASAKGINRCCQWPHAAWQPHGDANL